jgi:ribokinase
MSVFVVGALHLDVIVTAPHLPRPDETVVGNNVDYRMGGKGGNQAIAAAKMGVPTAMAGCVGHDDFGQRLLADLVTGNVDSRQVMQRPGASGMSVAIVEAGGDYGAVIVSGVNRDIDPARITIPDSARVVLLQNEIPGPANLAIATASRAAGRMVILNAAPARITESDLLRQVDLLIVNRVEAADLLGRDDAGLDPVEAARALCRSVPNVILTLGGEGLVLCQNGATSRMPAYKVRPISTHGAGDAFIGALAARLALEVPLAKATAFAQAAAALHVSTPVAERANITPQTVAAFLKPQTESP